MIFKEHMSKENGLCDLLNYAHFVDDGLILNKDGAFLLGYQFQGPDLYSASRAELDALTMHFSRMTTYLTDGWMLHIDEVRLPIKIHQEESNFPSPVAQLIDVQQQRVLETHRKHYENLQFLTFTWKFPLSIVKTTQHWFVEGMAKGQDDQSLTSLMHHFYEVVDRCVGLLSTHFLLKKLGSQNILCYLNYCISGEWAPISFSEKEGCFLDILLSRSPLIGGYVPRIGKKNIYVISIMGYLNEKTVSGLLNSMGTYPLTYRWSNRFIALSEPTAEREMKRYQRHWHNKVKGLFGIIKEAIFGEPTRTLNLHAVKMREQVHLALTENDNQSKRFGYWSSEIILMHEEIPILQKSKKDISRYLEQSGFSCVQEDINALDAWLGTIPGHGSCNVRRVFINSINLAHVLPLHTAWTGALFSDAASLLPAQSPPVFYATTIGKMLFRFHMDVADVGHQVVIGPTGSGKSTYLDFLIAQFLRYKNAQIFVFDKDYSHQAFTIALGGQHYNIGQQEDLFFCPLADLSTESKKMRAKKFIEDLIVLQNIKITSDIRDAIHNVIESLAENSFEHSRNLSIFCSFVQHEVIRNALKYYTVDGTMKLLDAVEDSLKKGYLQTFEMSWLFDQHPEVYLPVLQHIFNHIEARIESNGCLYPTLIILEEAWLYMAHPFFANTLKDWLKTLRKKNARVVFATQSLADLYDPMTQNLTSVTASIMESCLTKVFLPHISMDVEITKLYKKIGLSDRQIEIVSRVAIPKRHYYLVTPFGKRLIEFNWKSEQELALLFLGLSRERSRKLLHCIQQYADQWVYHWLKCHGQQYWADYFMQHILN